MLIHLTNISSNIKKRKKGKEKKEKNSQIPS